MNGLVNVRKCKTFKCPEPATEPSHFCRRECQVARQTGERVYSRVSKSWDLDSLEVARRIVRFYHPGHTITRVSDPALGTGGLPEVARRKAAR